MWLCIFSQSCCNPEGSDCNATQSSPVPAAQQRERCAPEAGKLGSPRTPRRALRAGLSLDSLCAVWAWSDPSRRHGGMILN